MNDLRTTPLELRLGEMRKLMAMLMAHLADNGLIDYEQLRADFLHVQDLTEQHDLVASDTANLFSLANLYVDSWQRARLPPCEPSPG